MNMFKHVYAETQQSRARAISKKIWIVFFYSVARGATLLRKRFCGLKTNARDCTQCGFSLSNFANLNYQIPYYFTRYFPLLSTLDSMKSQKEILVELLQSYENWDSFFKKDFCLYCGIDLPFPVLQDYWMKLNANSRNRVSWEKSEVNIFI